eukprot:COSAG05_NODE_10220_length_577_cov_1.083682_1_plen_22_part_10
MYCMARTKQEVFIQYCSVYRTS